MNHRQILATALSVTRSYYYRLLAAARGYDYRQSLAAAVSAIRTRNHRMTLAATARRYYEASDVTIRTWVIPALRQRIGQVHINMRGAALAAAGTVMVVPFLTLAAPSSRTALPAVKGNDQAFSLVQSSTLFDAKRKIMARERPQPSPATHQAQAPQVTHHLRRHHHLHYTVRTGDTLFGIARSHCGGKVRDWTGIFTVNRGHIANPNHIYVREHIIIACYDPSVDLAAYSPAPPHHHYHHYAAARSAPAAVPSSGVLSYGQIEQLWVSAGGPPWAQAAAANVAECESGGNTGAYNSSGATGLWQILGSVVPGNLYDAYTNALNAVSKFTTSGDTWAQWVCQP